ASIVGGAAGLWVTGALYDATGSYTLAFSLAIGASVLSAVAIWLAAPRAVRAVAGRVPRPTDRPALTKDLFESSALPGPVRKSRHSPSQPTGIRECRAE